MFNFLFPATCILCHHPSQRAEDICQFCLDQLPSLPQNCAKCANPITISGLYCGGCLQSAPPFHETHALYAYQFPVTQLIMGLKFNQQLVNAKMLGNRMVSAIVGDWYHNRALPHVILPMPLHSTRLKERGFNQAVEIARPIVNHLRLPMDVTSQRIRATAAQSSLAGSERVANVKNAFVVKENFRGCHVAILDDVITTGCTVTAFSLALKKAGAVKIDVWCCAKTLLESHSARAS